MKGSHGRAAERLIAPAPGITFPGAAQAFRIVRYTGALDTQRTTKKVIHCLTNLTPDQVDPIALAGLVQGHWAIENSIH